jgi:hypothetical protein
VILRQVDGRAKRSLIPGRLSHILINEAQKFETLFFLEAGRVAGLAPIEDTEQRPIFTEYNRVETLSVDDMG